MGHVQKLFDGLTGQELGAMRSQLVDQHRIELAIVEAANDAAPLHPVTKDLLDTRLRALGELIAEATMRMTEDVVSP